MEINHFFDKKLGRVSEMEMLDSLREANNHVKSLETRGDKGIYEDRGFYNEFEFMEKVEKLVKEVANDQELGEQIRRLCNGKTD